MAALLTPAQVRVYLSDSASENLLLDRQEFSDEYISLCMSLAISEYNSRTPMSSFTLDNFPSFSILMLGTAWQMYLGRSALMARNQLSYSDGGLQIPVEEKYELYASLAASFRAQFEDSAAKLKLSTNIEAGWSSVSSDEATFPMF